MSYKQLTHEQRYHISGLLKAGYQQSEITKELGVNKSTISRELNRNSRWNGYSPDQVLAQFSNVPFQQFRDVPFSQ